MAWMSLATSRSKADSGMERAQSAAAAMVRSATSAMVRLPAGRGLRPRLAGAARQARGLVLDEEVLVVAQGVAEALAGRAGAERVIEGEERRFRRLEGPPAGLAAIGLGKPMVSRADNLHNAAPSAFAECRLQGVHEARAVVLAAPETVP